MQLSDFGKKMTDDPGITRLMNDLGAALSDSPPVAMFGGGNPAQIPEVTEVFKSSLREILDDPAQAAAMLGNYDSPSGNSAFIKAVKDFFNRHYDLGISEDNITITPGSQTGYFMLLNLLAGTREGKFRKILFPLVPEYIGYGDLLLEPESFTSHKPKIQKIGDHEFKYKIDFESLEVDETVAGICLSRPTNPSGNVVTDLELERLGKLAQEHDIPLIIDNAYGYPFPGVITDGTKLSWNDHTVLSMSLSKVGLPTSRIGIFIGPVKLMQALACANGIVSLAPPSVGQYMMRPLIEGDEILRLSDDYIQPYYAGRAARAKSLIEQHFPKELPWRLHTWEGSYFFWLWLEGANMSSKDIYEYLKSRDVLVVTGEYFFPGQDITEWSHTRECIRINFARPDHELEVGIPLVAEAIRRAYN